MHHNLIFQEHEGGVGESGPEAEMRAWLSRLGAAAVRGRAGWGWRGEMLVPGVWGREVAGDIWQSLRWLVF